MNVASVSRRPAPLDVLTVLVLVVAIYLFVRPGSLAHAQFTQWLALRETKAAIERNWAQIESVAVPLYVGDGKPQLVEVLDYECPFCRLIGATVDSTVSGGVRIAVIHLPLSIHPRSTDTARAAICARNFDGGDALHRVLLRESAWQSEQDFESIASSLPFVRDPKFAACLTSPGTTETLRTHLAIIEKLAIRATPTIFSRDGLLVDAPSVAALTAFAQRQ